MTYSYDELSEGRQGTVQNLAGEILSAKLASEGEEGADSAEEAIEEASGEKEIWRNELACQKGLNRFRENSRDASVCAEVISVMQSLDKEDPDGGYVGRFSEHVMRVIAGRQCNIASPYTVETGAADIREICGVLAPVSREAADKKESLLREVEEEGGKKFREGGVSSAEPCCSLLIQFHYGGAEEKWNQIRHEAASGYFDERQYEDAADLFETLGDYKDAADLF